MQQALTVDMRDGDGRARVTVAGQVTRQSWVTLLRTLETTAAMYSDITIDLTWVTRLDAGILADLAETGRWLASRDGRLELVRLTPSIGGDQARDSSLSPADGLLALPQSSYAGSVKENEEAYAVELVSVRLRERFPGLPPEEVDEVVATYHHQFDGRPIRDFVPILVERQARDHLRTFPRQRN